ncbi:hypothetical protein RvY_17971 [Ramazzottius varieornatus]|uniref:GRIP domain-containing protein n=1 Tax=Ramazzottius varieornatus TaxID=947166 RepID=A0A1D1W438_RAMVA|nr:hypothetical protein RvY_17971 [Ramazzottius varieornatus]
MAAWFKQGLSTLGEGLSTLTKEILSEDIVPPADGPSSLFGSLQMASPKTEEHPDKSMEQFQQMVNHYETLLAEQRDRIAQLEFDRQTSSQPKLLNGTSSSTEQSSYINSTDHDKFLDIDLAATTPSPDPSRGIESSFPVLSAAQIHPDGFHRPLAHKDSVESGLVEAMEEELREKDVTIRHLMQEISRIKSESDGKGPLDTKDVSSHDGSVSDKTGAQEKIEMASQTEEFAGPREEATQNFAVQFEPEITFSDGQAQTVELSQYGEGSSPHLRASVDKVDSSTQDESEQTETSTQTDVEFSERERNTGEATAGSQTNDVSFSLSELRSAELSAQMTAECQTDGISLENLPPSKEISLSTAECQTDDSARESSPVCDSAFQTDDEEKNSTSTTESQTDELSVMPLEFADAEVQAGEEAQQSTVGCQSESTEEMPTVTSTEVQAGEQINQATTETQTDEAVEQAYPPTETVEIARVTSVQVETQCGEQINKATADTQTEEIPSASSEHSGVQTESTGDLLAFEEYSVLMQDKQQLQKELATAVEGRERSKKEIERLKGHLLQVEEGYAQDFEGAQKREEELRQMVFQLQQQVEESMSQQQHASLEVTEQIASLEREVRVLLEARDDAMTKFHQAEKNAAQSEASLSNLRMAFEHIKLDQRNELEVERQKARKNVKSLEEKLAEVTNRCAFLEEQAVQNQQNQAEQVRALAEADSLRQQLLAMSTMLESTERALQAAIEESSISSKSKVESALMKSMLLGYLIGPKGTKDDILRMMMSTLNFSDNEKQKVQYNQSSTLSSLFVRGTPGQAPEDSFGNMLVKFIEQESKPKRTEEMSNASRSSTPLPPASPLSQVPHSSFRGPSRPPPSLPDRFSQRDMLESILNHSQAVTFGQPHSSIDTV